MRLQGFSEEGILLALSHRPKDYQPPGDAQLPAALIIHMYVTTITKYESLFLRDTGASVTGMGTHFRSCQ
jgi:hypothetical protein